MAGDQDKPGVSAEKTTQSFRQRRPMAPRLSSHLQQGIDAAVSRDPNPVRGHALRAQVRRRLARWCEVELCEQREDAAIEFLRKRGREIVTPQARLHMANRN